MCQYIDVEQIINALPNPASTLCSHDVNIEFEICLENEEIIESGVTKKMRTCAAVFNIPDTHYIVFKGIKTNIGVFTKEGVIKNNSFGYVYAYVHNYATQSHILPIGMKMGVLSIKPYHDVCGLHPNNTTRRLSHDDT